MQEGSTDTNLSNELREFTPSFLWLLRDFYLKLEDEEGKQVGREGRMGQSGLVTGETVMVVRL